MKIFISWSGERSKAVAIALKTWLPFIFQDLEPWLSDHDIYAGARWNYELDHELESTDYGILCLTPENLTAPWLLFEAGSLAKAIKVARVVPYRLDLSSTDIEPPLGQFQGVNADEAGTLKLLESINRSRESVLPSDWLKRVFTKWWPDLNSQLNSISSIQGETIQRRPDRELLEETLQLIRRFTHGPDSISANPNLAYFQWPQLLERATATLSEIKKTLNDIGLLSHEEIVTRITNVVTELEVSHNREIQVSVFDEERCLVYHDWQNYHGAQVIFPGLEGYKVMDEIFRYSEGAVAWTDQSTNIQRPLTMTYRRMNIALFTTTSRPGWRIVVEAHQEVD